MFAGKNHPSGVFVEPGDEALVNRYYRLTRSNDIQKVRRLGKSYAHPLAVLCVLNSGSEQTHIGVIAGKNIGSAVKRNRAKRVLRAVLSEFIPLLKTGNDLLVIARNPISTADFHQVHEALSALLTKAGMISIL
jgi:ribonuclease P protein component